MNTETYKRAQLTITEFEDKEILTGSIETERFEGPVVPIIPNH